MGQDREVNTSRKMGVDNTQYSICSYVQLDTVGLAVANCLLSSQQGSKAPTHASSTIAGDTVVDC